MPGIRLLTPPAVLPVSVSEAKISERIDVNDVSNDASITAMLWAATQMAEEYTRRAFITQTWVLNTNVITPVISIPRPPLIGVVDDSVFYTDWNNVSTAIAPSKYFQDVVFEPGRLIFKDGYFPIGLGLGGIGCGWYYAGCWYYGTLSMEFDAGYGDNPGDVPFLIRQAILQIFGSLYQNRESQGIDCGAKQLLDAYKVEYI